MHLKFNEPKSKDENIVIMDISVWIYRIYCRYMTDILKKNIDRPKIDQN